MLFFSGIATSDVVSHLAVTVLQVGSALTGLSLFFLQTFPMLL